MTNRAEAKALTPYARRVLYELNRAGVTVTCDHVVDLLIGTNLAAEISHRKPTWPLRQLLQLVRMGYAKKHFADAGELSVTLWRITGDGRKVASWCNYDGSVAKP